MKKDRNDDKEYVGSDGKAIKLKHSKAISELPWYNTNSSATEQESAYEQKRDAYERYDPDSYKQIVESFTKNKKKKKPKKLAQKTTNSPIYDSYSRTTQTESARDRKDTAHYLQDLNVFEGLEFDAGRELKSPSKQPLTKAAYDLQEKRDRRRS